MSKVRAVARRSYLASEASGGWEETPNVQGQGRPGEATLHPRPGVVTLKSHPEPQGQGQQLGGATYTLGQVRQPGGATRGVVAAQAQEGLKAILC